MRYRPSSYDLSDGYVPASLIKEWFWCPTFAWLAIMSAPEPLPPHIATAERPALTRELRELVTYFGGDPYVRPLLRSRRLRLKGSPDLLIVTHDKAVVVEWKTSSPWARGDHVVAQLTAYALLAKEALGKAVVAVAASSTSYDEVEWERTAPKILRAAGEIRKAARSEEPPEPVHDGRRCVNCPYRRFCPWARG